MYLESGQWPARFELKKMRCLVLKQIMRQDENSQVYKFFQLQLSQPVRGDWVTTCKEDLSQLKIYDSFEDIKRMSETKLSQPKFNQQLSSTEFEVRLHSYTVIHHPPQTLCCCC
jgi:hypothetical protein